MADIVLISPRFATSFWGLQYALPIFGSKATMPVAGLPLLAALTPGEHTVTLIDEDIEAIDFDRCQKADMVGLTGMSVQRHRMREIAVELKRRGIFVVAGGPWISVQEDYLDGLADAIFVGEAEETWPQFLSEWSEGRHQRRYEQAERTDMSTVPAPRLDLLDIKKYTFGSVQISRGCPFACEFCDIIVTFGRRPRLKTSAQVIAELENLLAMGKRDVFIVDDNLIGNKKAIAPVLRDIAAWQREHGHRMSFFSEATIDLADDPEMLRLLNEIGFTSIFVGIETPNEASLRESKKHQNLRNSTGTMVEKIHRIQESGIEVMSGMIVGFDNDDGTIFNQQVEFLRRARIPSAMLGMLSAIPKTPLHTRLKLEGRLDPSDTTEYGTNVIPLRMSREELLHGYVKVFSELYSPEAYFGRVDALYLEGPLKVGRRMRHLRDVFFRRHALNARLLVEAGVMFTRLLLRVRELRLGFDYCRRIWRLIRRGTAPESLHAYMIAIVCHYHYYCFAKEIRNRSTALSNTI